MASKRTTDLVAGDRVIYSYAERVVSAVTLDPLHPAKRMVFFRDEGHVSVPREGEWTLAPAR